MATLGPSRRGCLWQIKRKNSLSSASFRIADQDAWTSLLLKRSSPVRVIDPRSVLSPVECSVGTKPRNPASWRTFLSWRQSPIRARSWLATIQPIPDTLHHILDTLGQFRIVLAEVANLSGRLKDLLLVKLQAVKQLIKLKAHGRGTGKLSQFILHHERPLATGRSGGKLHPFHEQKRFDALLHPHHLAHNGVAQLGEVTKLAIKRARNMDPFELSATQILRQSDTVKPIGLHSLSWRFGNHRWRGDQAPIVFRHQPIIQSVACGSSLIGKDDLLIGKMLAHVVHKMLRAVRHAQRFTQSLMIGKSHRDATLVHIESRKNIVVPRYKCLASHRSASLIQWLKFQPLYRLLSTRGEPRHPSYKSQDKLQ